MMSNSVGYLRLASVQGKLFAKYRQSTKWRHTRAWLSDMHAHVSEAWRVLPPVGVTTTGVSHVTPFVEYLSDAVVIAFHLLSRHSYSLEDLPAESEVVKTTELSEAVPYLHRLISAAYLNSHGRSDLELTLIPLNNFAFSVYRLAYISNRSLYKTLLQRHLKCSDSTP